jgi:hypothetical protein
MLNNKNQKGHLPIGSTFRMYRDTGYDVMCFKFGIEHDSESVTCKELLVQNYSDNIQDYYFNANVDLFFAPHVIVKKYVNDNDLIFGDLVTKSIRRLEDKFCVPTNERVELKYIKLNDDEEDYYYVVNISRFWRTNSIMLHLFLCFLKWGFLFEICKTNLFEIKNSDIKQIYSKKITPLINEIQELARENSDYDDFETEDWNIDIKTLTTVLNYFEKNGYIQSKVLKLQSIDSWQCVSDDSCSDNGLESFVENITNKSADTRDQIEKLILMVK